MEGESYLSSEPHCRLTGMSLLIANSVCICVSGHVCARANG